VPSMKLLTRRTEIHIVTKNHCLSFVAAAAWCSFDCVIVQDLTIVDYCLVVI